MNGAEARVTQELHIEFWYAADWHSPMEGGKTRPRDVIDTSPAPGLVDSIKRAATEHGATISESQSNRQDRRISIDMGIGGTEYYTLSLLFGSGGALAFLKLVQPLVIQWLKAKSMKSIKVKFGTTEIVIKGTDDITKAMEAIEKLALKAPSPRRKK